MQKQSCMLISYPNSLWQTKNVYNLFSYPYSVLHYWFSKFTCDGASDHGGYEQTSGYFNAKGDYG